MDLSSTVKSLPPFEDAYENVACFYESLPWDIQMIVFNFSDAGNREENLDILSKINCQNDMFGGYYGWVFLL
jgi:hypothetical protein